MEKEISEYKREVLKNQTEIDFEKQTFIKELNNGLGDEMLDYLKNPPKFDIKKEKKVQNKRKQREKKENIKRNIKKIFSKDKKNPEEF